VSIVPRESNMNSRPAPLVSRIATPAPISAPIADPRGCQLLPSASWRAIRSRSSIRGAGLASMGPIVYRRMLRQSLRGIFTMPPIAQIVAAAEASGITLMPFDPSRD
jgi:hypothetical protein